jgi:TP53 regulating kinase-like protein
MNPKLIAQGAEAKIILAKNQIVKDRISKSYRLKELDNKIRKSRTKKETKLMIKASKMINVPLPSIKEFDKMEMPFIDGKKLSEHLDELKNKKEICKTIGKDIAKLHDSNIIHGDLTTSNMILVDKINDKLVNKKKVDNKVITKGGGDSNKNGGGVDGGISKSNFQVFFIDFGLGFISHKLEDRAVDLHLLKQALESKHYLHWETLWKSVETGYRESKTSKQVLERLKAVEKRGRYKKK